MQRVPAYHSIISALSAASPHVCRACEPLAMSSTNGVIRNKCSKVQQLDPATPQKIPSHNPLLHSEARRFPPLEPDCYPTLTSLQIEMVLLTGNVGTLCFQSGPRRVLTGPRRGYFYRAWSSVELAVERGAGNAAWSKSQGGESSLLTQQFVMSVSVPACVVHVLLFVCVCALYCNQMRVGSYSMRAVFRQRELSVCLFVPAMCVFVSISRKQAFPWQGRQASESAVTSATPTHHHHHQHHLHPSSPSRREAGNRYAAI